MSTSVRAMVCAVLVPVRDRCSGRTYRVPPSYAKWLAEGGKNPQILDGSDSAGATTSGLRAVEELYIESASTVERLILAGWSEAEALRTLPYEVYVVLFPKKVAKVRKRPRTRMKRKVHRMTAKP